MTPRLLTPLLLLLLLLLVAVPASAQRGGRTCQYDLECGVAEACNDAGVCVPHGSLAVNTASGGGVQDDCGADRRCRINRLKRKNRAQRHADMLSEERRVRNMIEDEEKRELEEHPRVKDPLSFALRVSRLGPLGAHVGYVFAEHFQPSFEFTYSSDLYVSEGSTFDSAGVSGSLEGWWLRGGLAYFLLDSWFSPYLTAGFQVGLGQFYNYNYDFEFGGDFGSNVQTRFHAAEFGGGFDLQFKFGLQTRLGVVYRPLIYNQARTGPGQYDPLTRQGLADWYKRGAAVDVVWLLGWAI